MGPVSKTSCSFRDLSNHPRNGLHILATSRKVMTTSMVELACLVWITKSQQMETLVRITLIAISAPDVQCGHINQARTICGWFPSTQTMSAVA